MLWLFPTSLSVIIGAEVNAEMEQQTAIDTTKGRPAELGSRNAYAADTLGEAAEQVSSTRELLVAEQRVDIDPGAVPAKVAPRTTETCPFRFSGLVGALARVFGVRSDRAHASLARNHPTVCASISRRRSNPLRKAPTACSMSGGWPSTA